MPHVEPLRRIRKKRSWRSAVHLVKKKDGRWRFVVDYRALNKVTLPDSYPLPNIEEMLDNLKNAKFFSKLDLTDGFWQIKLAEKDREKTGFAAKSGFWRWKVLPMGLKNASSTFQKAMDEALGNLKWKICMVFVDDILIYSQTYEEHLLHIKAVF